MTRRNWLELCLLSIIWGSTFVFAKVAVAEIPPLVLVFCRVAIAAAALHCVLRIRGLRFPTHSSILGSFLAMGLLNNAIPFSLIFWGQTALAASLASILNATTPIFTVLVAALLFRQEVLRPHRIAGVVLGFAGIVAMLSPGLAGLTEEPLWAEAACLGAAVSYAFAAAFARRFKDMPAMVAATGQLTGSSLLILPLALWQAAGWHPGEVSLVAWSNVAALGLLGTAFAYLLYFRLLSQAGATNASLVTLLIPLNTVIMGALFLGEALSPHQLAGLMLLLFGLTVLDGRWIAALRRKHV